MTKEKVKIPTAEEFLMNRVYVTTDGVEDVHDSLQSVKDALIEFANMHVQAALKEALESIPCLGSSTDIATYEEVEDAVLNAYPLNNIK